VAERRPRPLIAILGREIVQIYTILLVEIMNPAGSTLAAWL